MRFLKLVILGNIFEIYRLKFDNTNSECPDQNKHEFNHIYNDIPAHFILLVKNGMPTTLLADL